MNHKADEAYMAKMCAEGWAATSLVEGVWTFEPCKPNQYVYRVCYLRGKSEKEVETLKAKLAAEGIEYVSRYSFWAIFRSEHDFALYKGEEELAICESIRRPMPFGATISWIMCAVSVFLAIKISAWFAVLSVLLAVYAFICTCLAVSYGRLIRSIKNSTKNKYS